MLVSSRYESNKENPVIDKIFTVLKLLRRTIMTPILSIIIFFCFWELSLVAKFAAADSGPNQICSDSKLTNNSICSNLDVIASEPKEVENFTCISYNWEVLNCSWHEPNNGIETHYSIFYSIRNSRRQAYNCPVPEQNFCQWTLNTNPFYRRTFEYLFFFIDGINKLGNSSQKFRWHNYAHIIPAPPTDLTPLKNTSHSIYLQWNIGIFETFVKPLDYRVEYKRHSSQYWNAIKFNAQDFETNKGNIRINVTNLEYPNMNYDFRVSMKSSLAGEDGWSQPAYVTANTSSCAPYQSPQTDIGSFDIRNQKHNREVQIYWKPIPDDEHNGDEFRYEITVLDEDDDEVNIKPVSITDAYATFAGLTSNVYKFAIKSVNSMGSAPSSSIVYLPKKYDILPKPISFTKVIFEEGFYELSWKLPNVTMDKVNNFTIFWCQSNIIHPYPCTSGLHNWTHLSADTFKQNFTTDTHNDYQFAISVNSINSSSGMLWTQCAILHNRIGVIRNVRISAVGSSYIHIRWLFECTEFTNGIKGYNITYCPVVNNSHHDKCFDSAKTYLVYGDETTNKVNITGLLSYTMYQMSVAIFTDKLLGPSSEWIYERTKDAAPGMEDVKVDVVNITDSTAVIKWNMPISLNGLLDHYEVRYNNEKIIVNDTTTVKLTGLRCYDLYNVTVVACTTFCSGTKPETFQTKIGTPTEVQKVIADIKESKYVTMKWQPPAFPGGPYPHYEVKVEKDVDTLQEEHETSELQFNFEVSCESEGIYKLFVRAKNIDNSDKDNLKQYVGPWSSPYYIECGYISLSMRWIIMLYSVIVISLLWVLICCVKKGCIKFHNMQNVDVVLPAKFNLPEFNNKDSIYPDGFTSWTEMVELDHENKILSAEKNCIEHLDGDIDADSD